MMELPPLKYTLDNVVVGWREEAVSFAHTHGYHLIVNSEQRPFHYSVGLETVKSNWLEGIYQLGIQSLLPVPFEVQTISLDDSKLKIITRGNTQVLFDFGKLHIFDLDNFNNLEVEEVVEDHHVYDMFDVVEGSRLGDDFTLLPQEEFIKSINFVSSNRVDKNTSGDFKDIIVRSVIPDADLRSFDFSETVVRLMLERKLKEYNIQAPTGASLKVRHSFRHTNKNNFRFRTVGDLDSRVTLHA